MILIFSINQHYYRYVILLVYIIQLVLLTTYCYINSNTYSIIPVISAISVNQFISIFEQYQHVNNIRKMVIAKNQLE